MRTSAKYASPSYPANVPDVDGGNEASSRPGMLYAKLSVVAKRVVERALQLLTLLDHFADVPLD